MGVLERLLYEEQDEEQDKDQLESKTAKQSVQTDGQLMASCSRACCRNQ
jgi:hypothetical protein